MSHMQAAKPSMSGRKREPDAEARDDLPDGEAENRKHFQKTLLLAMIGIDDLPADPELQPIARAGLIEPRRRPPARACFYASAFSAGDSVYSVASYSPADATFLRPAIAQKASHSSGSAPPTMNSTSPGRRTHSRMVLVVLLR